MAALVFSFFWCPCCECGLPVWYSIHTFQQQSQGFQPPSPLPLLRAEADSLPTAAACISKYSAHQVQSERKSKKAGRTWDAHRIRMHTSDFLPWLPSLSLQDLPTPPRSKHGLGTPPKSLSNSGHSTFFLQRPLHTQPVIAEHPLFPYWSMT
ncbi:predicted protein [Histoplasma capsulatum G186AR]|uniref:Secreted protein n=1 Tax=Ajellomyces capsulatus (strain G186AR / H82 / ATCC MYA-2454 / RMSCC 2432) TaxID=447093 RepID=C0NQ96_AJECG|nr:uncharacterized protein HCBG_05684 [Histoplasma capsulatum G186AR]EEH06368.1 predicted protein [Histoplasma capsulatum G186AR]